MFVRQATQAKNIDYWFRLPIVGRALLQGRQFAQNKTNVMETVMQLLKTNRIHPISGLSGIRGTRARAYTVM